VPDERGALGVRAPDLELQRLLHPPGKGRVESLGWSLGPGDEVMQVANDHDKDVVNGDPGLVKAVDAVAGELVVAFDGQRARSS
jgi:exodeoxyribonuclease V alpha subunit